VKNRSDMTDEKKIDRIIDALVLLFIAFSLISIAGTQIALGLLVLATVFSMVRNRHERPMGSYRTPLDLAFLLFALACVIATVFSLRPAESLANLKNLLLISAVYVLGYNLRGERRIARAVDLLVLVSVLVGAGGLLATDLPGGERMMPLQSTTMTWGAMSTIFTTLTFSLFLFTASRRRWLYLAAFAVQFIGMLFSYVRGAWIGFIAGLALLILMRSRKLLFLGAAALMLVFFIAPRQLQDRILSITDLNVGSTQVRFTQWRNSISIVRHQPLTGVGWIDLGEIHRSVAPPGADLDYQAYRIGHFHNNLIMILVCLGVIGLAALLYMLYRIFRMELLLTRQCPPPSLSAAWTRGSLAALTAFWVNGLFDWTFGDAEPVTLLWLTVGICLAVERLAEKSSNSALK